MKLTVAIICQTPPGERLLSSCQFADEIVIIIDAIKGKDISKGKTKVYYRSLDQDFAAQRNFALSKAKGEWVLFVDTDEIISTELIREIQEKIKHNKPVAYFIPRKDLVFHQVLKHGESGNIKIIRLAQKNAGKFVRPVHEVWKIKGRVGELSSPLYHTKDNLVSGFLPRMTQYSQLDAPVLSKENKPFSALRLFINPLFKFKLNYVLRGGILDGYPGLFQAYLMSVQSLTVRVFQWKNKN